MKQYQHIFFDLDHTLWDFDKNCSETLIELYERFEFQTHGFTAIELIEKYKEINYRMWDDYNRGKITKEEIRSTRFQLTFKELGADESLVPENLNEEFLKICPAKGHVFPYTHETLDYLSSKYTLHIITNGFKETQAIKISTSRLDTYFSTVVLAESCGYSKPDQLIFEYALKQSGANKTNSIMIGDDLYTDMYGARNAGLDQIFFNPTKQIHSEIVTHEISCISELAKLL